MVLKIIEKLLQFKGFKFSHLTNQEDEQEHTPPTTNTNCHFLIFGSSGSEKTSFLKHYLDQTNSDCLGFARDENEFLEQIFVQLVQLEKKLKLDHLLRKRSF